VTNRRGTVVSRDLPAGERGERDVEAAVRRLAVRWRLAGGDRGSFAELVGNVANEVFRPACCSWSATAPGASASVCADG
jgi:hypothetical protein